MGCKLGHVIMHYLFTVKCLCGLREWLFNIFMRYIRFEILI